MLLSKYIEADVPKLKMSKDPAVFKRGVYVLRLKVTTDSKLQYELVSPGQIEVLIRCGTHTLRIQAFPVIGQRLPEPLCLPGMHAFSVFLRA